MAQFLFFELKNLLHSSKINSFATVFNRNTIFKKIQQHFIFVLSSSCYPLDGDVDKTYYTSFI
jgi:hypothetical protein